MRFLTLYKPNTFHTELNNFNKYFDSTYVDSVPSPNERVLYYLPVIHIKETEDSYVMKMDLPGFDEKNIEVKVDGSTLTIASKPEDKKQILRERGNTTFNRSFQLPGNVDTQAISAAFKDDRLSININKLAGAKKRAIQINAL